MPVPMVTGLVGRMSVRRTLKNRVVGVVGGVGAGFESGEGVLGDLGGENNPSSRRRMLGNAR